MDSLTPRTGEGGLDTSAILNSALDIFRPVMESATVLAAHYAKACGRDVVLQEDMKLGMMYAARYVTGRQIGSLFPEIYEEESCSDSEGSEGSDFDETVQSLQPHGRLSGMKNQVLILILPGPSTMAQKTTRLSNSTSAPPHGIHGSPRTPLNVR